MSDDDACDLSPNDIRSAYRFLLDREPEPELNLEVAAKAFAGWREAREYYLNSAEAKAKLLGGMNLLTSWIRVPTRFGRQIYLNRSDTGVALNIMLSGEHEPDVGAAIIQLLPSDGVFLDVGANVGWFTLLAADKLARAGQGGRVISVEGNPQLTPYLCGSVLDSGLTDVVTIVPYAVSDASKLVAFRTEAGRNLGGEQARAPDAFAPGRRHIGPAVRLDDILADLERLDLIKIDIEGSEPLALAGARGLIEKFRPAIIMEINPRALANVAGCGASDVLHLLRNLGYAPFRLDAPDAPLAEEEALLAVERAGYADFLFFPIPPAAVSESREV